jgi:hypothetical protein
LAVHTGRFQINDPKQVWTDSNPGEIKASWRKTEIAIAKLIEFLTGTVRWTSESLVPSFTALVPLVVLLARGNNWTLADRRLARRWLLLASIHGYFSGAAQTELDQSLRAIESQPSITQLWNRTRRRLRRLRAEDFETARLSGPVMSLFLSMLRERDAKDWQSASPLDGTVVGHNAALHVHHFFPRALLNKRKELSVVDINTFANYTIISAHTNLDVSTEEPATYLDRLDVAETELEKQVVPVDRSLWRVGRYKDFLMQRRRLLAEQANAFLGL